MSNISTRIPENWTTRMLAEVSEIKTGGTPSKDEPAFWGGNIPWMASGDVHLKRIRNVEGRITELGLKNSNARLLPPGTVMMAMNGQGKTRGTVAVLESSVTCNQSLAGIIPKSDFITPDFLFYNLESRYQEIRNLTGDGTRTGLNLKLIGDIQVTLPSLPEQRKIAAILTSVDDAIAGTQRIIEQTEVVKRGLMQQLLTKGIGHTSFKQTEIGEIPTEWEVAEIKDLFVERKDTSSDTSQYPLYSLTIEAGLTQKTDRYERSFLLKNKEQNQYRLVFPNDIVFNPMNLRWGAISIFKEQHPVSVSAYYNVLRLNDQRSSVDYFAAVLMSEKYMQRYETIATGTLIEKKRVHLSQFKKLAVPVPPRDEQRKISSVLMSVEGKIRYEHQKLRNLSNLKVALLDVLLAGKVRVQVDEPSEVSL